MPRRNPFPGTVTVYDELGKREGYINAEVWVTTLAVKWLQESYSRIPHTSVVYLSLHQVIHRMNHFRYADDLALLAISPRGLRRLINICLAYGLKFEIVFNLSKTKLIVFRNRNFRSVIFPAVHINGQVI